MINQYWVLRLDLSSAIFLLRKQRRGSNVKVFYIDSNPAALKFINMLNNYGWKFTSEHIEPGLAPVGPKLPLCDVRNEKDQVITFSVIKHILNIRRRLTKTLVDYFRDLPFFKDAEKHKTLDKITAWIGIQIGQEITTPVVVAHYASWFQFKEITEVPRRNILVIPNCNHWAEQLKIELTGTVDEVHISGRDWVKSISRLKRVLTRLYTAIKFKSVKHPEQTTAGTSKLMFTYAQGIRPDRRNDAPYIHAAGIDPKNVCILFNQPHCIPDEDELNRIKESGMNMLVTGSLKRKLKGGIHWTPTHRMEIEQYRFNKLLIESAKFCVLSRKKWTGWIIDKLWTVSHDVSYWKDIFSTNNIRINVAATALDTNYLQAIALHELDSMHTEYERTIRTDYCTYFQNTPNHVSFITGPNSVIQIPEPTNSEHTIQTGYSSFVKQSVEPLNEYIQNNSGKKLICVLDESPPWDFLEGNLVNEIYTTAIDVVKRREDLTLVIKPKKKETFDYLPHIYNELKELEKMNKCIILDTEYSPVAVVELCVLTITAPSTAMYESALKGIPTVVYNPMKVGCKTFYMKNGLNKRIFEDRLTLLKSIEAFLNNTESEIGDCSDIISEIDIFHDDKGAVRLGDYLKECLVRFDEGMNRDSIIEQVNEIYKTKCSSESDGDVPITAFGA